MIGRGAQAGGKGPDQGVGWPTTLVLICLTSAWALVWMSCALDGWGWGRPEGRELILMLVTALAPRIFALGVAFGLWKKWGLPFLRSRGKR